VLQAGAYTTALPLSLGPRVILQPWLLRQGYLMYEQIVDIHSPLMPLAISALAPLIPDGLTLAKLVQVGLLSATTLLTFLAAWRVSGPGWGLWAAAFFVAWSRAFGFGKLWHESLLAPLYALLLCLADPGAERRSPARLLLIGLVGGIALTAKQHAIVVVGALAVWHALSLWRARRPAPEVVRDLALLGAGAALPVVAAAGYQLIRAGTLAGMWRWTVTHSFESDYQSTSALWPTFEQVRTLAVSGLLAPAALTWAWAAHRRADPRWRWLGWGLWLMVAASATVYPRFEMFHLQPALPVMAWLSALTLAGALRTADRACAFAVGTAIALSLLWLLQGVSAYHIAFGDPPQRIDEYSSLAPLAEEISTRITPAEQVYIFPDDEGISNLYYLLHRTPPRFWVFSYPWYGLDPIQQRVIDTLESDPPEWVIRFASRQHLANGLPQVTAYVEAHYLQEAVVQSDEGEVWLLRRVR